MAGDKLRKKVVFELATDLNKINREIDSFEKQLKQAKWAEKEAKSAGDEHKLALVKQQRAVSELREQRKKASKALKQYNRDQQKSNTLAKRASEFMRSSALAYVGAGVAIGGTVKILKDLISAGVEWAGTVEGVDGRVRELSEKIGNMIPAKGLAKLAEYEKAMNLTTKETEALAAAAVDLSRIAKIDTAQALDKLTRSITSGSTRALQELGIQTEEITGTKLEKMNYVLGKLTGSMDDTSRAASNAAESMESFKNRREMAFARLGYAITQTDAFKSSLSALGEVSNTVADYMESMGQAAKNLSSRQLEAKKATGDFFRSAAKYAVMAVPFLGQFYSLQEKITGKFRDEDYKKAHAAAKETERVQARLDAVWKSWQDRQRQKAREDELATQETSQRARDEEAAQKRRVAAAKSANRKILANHRKHLADLKRAEERHAREVEKAERNRQRRQESYERRLTSFKRHQMQQRIDIDKRLHESAQAALEANAARVERDREIHSKRVEMYQQHSDALFQSIAANALAAESFGGFIQKMGADVLNYLGQMALKKAAFEFAEGLAALGITWGAPNGSSINHFAASAAFAALGIGGMAAGAAVGSAGGGSKSMGGEAAMPQSSFSTDYRESSISSSRESERSSSGPKVVQYITIRGRSDLLTKKDIQTIGKRLAEGRR